jgi:putative transposase
LPDVEYLFHDKTVVVTRCGRICLGNKKMNFSQVVADQAVGTKEVHDDIWLVSFMDYDLGYFDLETRVLEPLENPFGPKVSPMQPVLCVTHVSGPDRKRLVAGCGFEPPTFGL